MSIAIDTNVLVRILVQDPTAPDQCAAARRLVAEATARSRRTPRLLLEVLVVALDAPSHPGL